MFKFILYINFINNFKTNNRIMSYTLTNTKIKDNRQSAKVFYQTHCKECKSELSEDEFEYCEHCLKEFEEEVEHQNTTKTN